MWCSDFLSSETGQRLIYTSRWLRRLRIDVSGIEPRAKHTMARAERLAFQSAVLSELKELRRECFRGPLIVKLNLRTTGATPAHPHTIAKNLLDLLGRPDATLSRRKGVLYSDDSQVHGLLVSCKHGASEPDIRIEARSVNDFRNDLAIAFRALEAQTVGSDFEDGKAQSVFPSSGSSWLDDGLRPLLGERVYESMRTLAHADAQRDILRHNGLGIRDLVYLYRALDLSRDRNRPFYDELAAMWEEHLKESPFRIVLSELPVAPGTSQSFRHEVDGAVRNFQQQFKKLLVPIRVPLALEVVVKPAPDGGAKSSHDLDNILRRYLIPKLIEILSPPASYHWTTEGQGVGSHFSPDSGSGIKRTALPKSTAVGLVRFEAWRIPRSLSDRSPGFVVVSLVADDFGHVDSLRVLDGAADAWIESLD
jgi:Holliday junction resolvase RusA-like endonuclease